MKNVLITGGVQGIGRALVDQFCAQGDIVCVFDCIDETDERVQELTSVGVTYIRVDIASVDSICAGFAQLECRNLDVLINNAGITRDMLSVRLKESDWDAVLNVNLKGAFFCCQEALKRMAKQPKSYIINVSSVVGLHGNPGQINYAASKAGIVALTKTLAKEYARRDVMVNAVAPGFIQTRMTEKLSDAVKESVLAQIPLRRLGTPQDVANVISFLVSGNADYLTGQVITIDGGMTI